MKDSLKIKQIRKLKAEELIKKSIFEIISFHYSIYNVFITRVEMNNDLSTAKIFCTFEGDSKNNILNFLKSESKKIQFALTKKVLSRKHINLSFYYDNSLEEIKKINQLIKKLDNAE